jgi:hypothetical protein
MSAPTAASPLTPPPQRRKSRRLGLRILLALLLLIVLGVVLWSWVALSYVYSSGQRTGYIRGLTHTGWLCKTWEGQLVTSPTPVAPSQVFDFTLRNDSLATILQSAQDKPVTLSYSQHLRSPSTCFGETQYFIEGVAIQPQAIPPQ